MPLDQKDTGAEMPFLDHLEELRWRIVKGLVALIIAMSVTFTWSWYNFTTVMEILVGPIRPLLVTGHLVYTSPVGSFTIFMQVAGVMGLVLASPVVGYQVWCFMSPALTPRERRVIIPVLGFAALLFASGVALAIKVFVPVTLQLMQGLQSEYLQPMITTDEYFGFMFFICLAFGAVFELPVLVLILTALGLVTPQAMSRVRRWAVVISLVVCEIVTPGDFVISTLILWVPVYGLYELSIVVSWIVWRAKKKREAAANAIGAGAAA